LNLPSYLPLGVTRVGEAIIAKRLDMFLIFEAFLDEASRIKQWVTTRGESDHNPIVLYVIPTI
jgi:hypothetical protein